MLAQGHGERAPSRKEAPGWGALVSLPGRARDSGLFGEQAGPSLGGPRGSCRPAGNEPGDGGWLGLLWLHLGPETIGACFLTQMTNGGSEGVGGRLRA